MFEGVVNFVKASRPAQFALTFLAGAIVAGVFYPTKHIETKLQKTFDQQISTLKQQHATELSTVETQYKKQVEEVTATNVQLDRRVTQLTTQVTTLKLHQKKTFYKIIHPDGTIEERASTTTDSEEEQQLAQQAQEEVTQKISEARKTITDEFTQQITTMQREWDSKEKSYKDTIATLTESKVVDINPKNLTVDVGALTNLSYYGHVTYNILGPFVFGLQGQFGSSSAAGAGLGLRF